MTDQSTEQSPIVIDAQAVRALIDRAGAMLGGPASLDGALGDVEEALTAASDLGDEDLVLDALECRARVLTGMGEAVADDWLAVEHAAIAGQAWPRAAVAMRMQAMALIDDDAPSAEAPSTRLAQLATDHGLTTDLAWAESLRAEIRFVLGQWDEATTVAMRAVAAGGRTEDSGATLRAWHVVVPIASERGDVTRLGLAFYPYSLRRQIAPDSHYRRLLDAAAMIRFSAAGLCPPPDLTPAELLPSVSGSAVMPHWLAAVEVVVDAWISAGEFAAAEHAVEAMGASAAGGSASRLGAGAEALLRARLLHAEGSPEGGVASHAWRALELFTAAKAPWWISKAIHMLVDANEAPDSDADDGAGDLAAQAKHIEAALGL